MECSTDAGAMLAWEDDVMKTLMLGVAALGLVIGPLATAQPYPYGDHGYGRHDDRYDGGREDRHDDRYADRHRQSRGDRHWEERADGRDEWRRDERRHAGWGADRGAGHRWARGERLGYDDWERAERVDYRRHRLSPPPRGYEWRRVDDSYVLAAVATGLITAIILNSGR